MHSEPRPRSVAAHGWHKRPLGEQAFSRLDLLVTLGMVVLLVSLQASTLANTKGKGSAVTCLHNLKKLASAWLGYADDNQGRLVGNLDGGAVQTLSLSNQTWALGWLDYQGGAPAGANTNASLLTQYSPLAPYLSRSAGVFKCPSDPSLSRGVRGAPRVRSYSMNSYMGQNRAYTSGYRMFTTINEIIEPAPARAFVVIDEREDSINDGSFAVDMAGFSPQSPDLYRIVDYPADWHNRAANLSFVDGHVETWKWQDSRTMPTHRLGLHLSLNTSSPTNADLARIQAATSSRTSN